MHSLDANTDTATINGHCERQKKVECNICIRTAGQVSRIPVANGDNGWGLFTSATVDGPVLRSFSFRHSITSKRSAWRSNYLANLAFPPGSESRIPVKQTFLAPVLEYTCLPSNVLLCNLQSRQSFRQVLQDLLQHKLPRLGLTK